LILLAVLLLVAYSGVLLDVLRLAAGVTGLAVGRSSSAVRQTLTFWAPH
jgi:hypothetical protein